MTSSETNLKIIRSLYYSLSYQLWDTRHSIPWRVGCKVKLCFDIACISAVSRNYGSDSRLRDDTLAYNEMEEW